jgi:dTDP-4-dehydrorhamnose reductase
MIIGVTGHEGTIGKQLVKRGYSPLECDITDFDQVRDTVAKVNPDVIIHCAAMTDVRWCEENEKLAYKVNVRGTANVLEAFAGKFIYLSTVHVFNGNKYFAYSEKHTPDPVNSYGFTKLAGESVVRVWGNQYTIVRISKAFDYEYLADTLGYLDETDDNVEFTTLIKRSFVHTEHLAEGIAHVAENDLNVDVLNVSGTDTLSYYDFWLQATNILGFDVQRVIPRKHKIKEVPRPFRGGLSVRKAKKLGVPLYSSIDGLKNI